MSQDNLLESLNHERARNADRERRLRVLKASIDDALAGSLSEEELRSKLRALRDGVTDILLGSPLKHLGGTEEPYNPLT